MKKINWCSGWSFYKEGSGKTELLDLPHDAMQAEERRPDSPGGAACGFCTGGSYWYEKNIDMSMIPREGHAELVFEGAYQKATVYLNERKLLEHDSSYTSFSVNLDGKLVEDGENRIRVHVENDQLPNSRWYTGSGIYRPVWLLVSQKKYIERNGIRIDTRSINPAKIMVKVAHKAEQMTVRILKDGKCLAESPVSTDFQVELEIPEAKLWSSENPELYTCQVDVYSNGVITDQEEAAFGIRTLSWDSQGLCLNGKKLLLKGACLHHDNGILGARSYAVSEERRVRLLQKAGYNAIRSAHNHAALSLIEACDRLGMLLMDETWDTWYRKKSSYDLSLTFADNWKTDIQAIEAEDHNHPSVIMYSIGNEISEPATQKGQDLEKEMIAEFHRLDPSRPVSAGMNLMIISRSADGNDIYQDDGGRNTEEDQKASGMNSLMFNIMTSMIGSGMNKAANGKKADQITSPALDALDIAGYNYASGRYPLEGKQHPNRVIFGSETFPGDIVKNWEMVEKYPYLVGDFMWTGWDYLGEAGAGAWTYSSDGKGFEKPYPWLLADVGALNILGEPTGELYLAQAAWHMLSHPVIAVRPINQNPRKLIKSAWRSSNALRSWAYKGCEGAEAYIEVYGNGAFAAIEINGKKSRLKRMANGKMVFKAKYAAGRIRAYLYDGKKHLLGSDELLSAASSITPVIRQETERIPGQPVYLSLKLEDRQGIVESNADCRIDLEVNGGKLLAFGSARPATEESFLSASCTTYYGSAQAVVLPESDSATVKITAKSVYGCSELQV